LEAFAAQPSYCPANRSGLSNRLHAACREILEGMVLVALAGVPAPPTQQSTAEQNVGPTAPARPTPDTLASLLRLLAATLRIYPELFLDEELRYDVMGECMTFVVNHEVGMAHGPDIFWSSSDFWLWNYLPFAHKRFAKQSQAWSLGFCDLSLHHITIYPMLQVMLSSPPTFLACMEVLTALATGQDGARMMFAQVPACLLSPLGNLTDCHCFFFPCMLSWLCLPIIDPELDLFNPAPPLVCSCAQGTRPPTSAGGACLKRSGMSSASTTPRWRRGPTMA
jgi:hypothetical protein